MTSPRKFPLSEEATADRPIHEGVHFDQLVAPVEDYAIYMTGLDGIVHDWNAGATRQTGYAKEEVVGSHFSRFFRPEDVAAELPEKEQEAAREAGTLSLEGWRLRKEGDSYWAAVTITAVYSACGELAGFLNITLDLSERVMAEKSLRESEERLRLAIESVEDYAICLLDLEGHVMTWNRAARRIQQYDEGEIFGAHFSVFYPPEVQSMGIPAAMLREALDTGRAEDEGWCVRKDGSTFWGSVTITALKSDNPALCGYVKITRDLTRQRQMELLRESGERKDVFLATLAHELRNPLAPMVAAVELIRKQPDNAAMVRQMGEILRTQLGHMTHLIDDLLDMARISSEGEGRCSEFTIPLPCLPREASAEAYPEARTPLPVAKAARILIADDSRSVADTLAMMLEPEGYEVEVAYDGQAAVDIAKTFSPHCAILDLGMPGMSGLEAGREIRRLFPDIVLAALTAWATDEDRAKSKAAGFDLHLVKPATLDQIQMALCSLRNTPPRGSDPDA